MPRKLYIDTDVLVYESAFSAQKTIYTYRSEVFKSHKDWLTFAELNNLDAKAIKAAGELTSHVEYLPQSVAKMQAKRKLDQILEACDSTNYDLLLSGTDNYREQYAVTKGYKANRVNTPKPMHYEFVRGCFMDWGAEVVNGCEADDAMGIAMAEDNTGVICTIDKDLNMIPGRHYNWGTGQMYNVPELDSHRWFLRQMLTGDSTDNIPGLPGIGEVKANAILEPYRNNLSKMLNQVNGYYAGGPYRFKDGTTTPENVLSYMNEQGVLLWIQRVPDERWTLDHYVETYVRQNQ